MLALSLPVQAVSPGALPGVRAVRDAALPEPPHGGSPSPQAVSALCLSLSLAVCLSVYLSLCLSVSLSLARSLSLSRSGPARRGQQSCVPMALAAARARALRALSRPRPPGRVPVPARSRCSRAGAGGALPPGGYRAWQERAARDPAGFWADVARGWLRWDSPFHTAWQPGVPAGSARWFLGGRLNVSGKANPVRAGRAGRKQAGNCEMLEAGRKSQTVITLAKLSLLLGRCPSLGCPTVGLCRLRAPGAARGDSG